MALDPVNPKALKGKFKDREDKDIDNDGDSDSSDEYLHKRRQAVSKAIGKVKEAKLTPDEMKKALDSAKAQPKDKVSLKKPPFKMDEAVNVKAIQKAVDDGKSMDVIMTMFANKKTTNTDEISKVVKDYAWKKRMKKESVVLSVLTRMTEAKDGYTVAHKTFSSAVQHAEEVTKKRGFDIDPEEWDRKVAMGPRKPGTGKTNSYNIDLTKNGKDVKQKLHMQVYYDEGRYELNMYIS